MHAGETGEGGGIIADSRSRRSNRPGNSQAKGPRASRHSGKRAPAYVYDERELRVNRIPWHRDSAFTPDVFCCAVDIVGPSNLVTLLRSIPPYWEPMRRMFAVRVGDVDKEEEFLKSRSPLFKADRIRIPLLIAQGANDPRVPLSESEQMLKRIRGVGTPVWYLMAKDEGHGFAKKNNRDFQLFASILLLKEYLLK